MQTIVLSVVAIFFFVGADEIKKYLAARRRAEAQQHVERILAALSPADRGEIANRYLRNPERFMERMAGLTTGGVAKSARQTSVQQRKGA